MRLRSDVETVLIRIETPKFPGGVEALTRHGTLPAQTADTGIKSLDLIPTRLDSPVFLGAVLLSWDAAMILRGPGP